MTAEALDLTALDDAVKRQDAGIGIDILGPDGKTPLGLTIIVAGPDSERALAAQEELADEMLGQESLGRAKARETMKRGIRYLARITIGWTPAVKIGGNEIAYSVENAEMLYTRFRFIREQIDRAAADRARFMNG